MTQCLKIGQDFLGLHISDKHERKRKTVELLEGLESVKMMAVPRFQYVHDGYETRVSHRILTNKLRVFYAIQAIDENINADFVQVVIDFQ